MSSAIFSAGNIITFTGIRFPTGADYEARASYQSMTVKISTWTATNAIATFPLGIPLSGTTLVKPRLFFTKILDGIVYYANNNS